DDVAVPLRAPAEPDHHEQLMLGRSLADDLEHHPKHATRATPAMGQAQKPATEQPAEIAVVEDRRCSKNTDGQPLECARRHHASINAPSASATAAGLRRAFQGPGPGSVRGGS